MCGIAGKFTYDPAAPVSPSLLEAMTDAVRHRGPDAAGLYVDSGIGLGHRRLSIIDLATGDQPLTNEDRTVWVVFNGEIYNFTELRRELETLGHRFRTLTDTEVIVHAYEQWGEASVERFRGMFAYAIWDERRRRLVLVRDRIGVKPLYFAATPTGVTFGSEIKSVILDRDVPHEWSPEALDAYLALLYVPAPHTIYRDIYKLPAGHLLIADPNGVTVRRYWDLAFTGDGPKGDEAAYLDRLDALVTEAVRLRLLSDVPLGAFLSGGIDSSVVVAAMAEVSRSRVVTTSVGFDEQAFNELEAARAVASRFGTESHERVVRADVADLLPKLAWHLDEPFADSSAVPTYYVSQAAREHVTVALSGDGADELWAGYARHRAEHYEIAARRWLGTKGARLAGKVAEQLPSALKGAHSLRHLSLSPEEACVRKHSYGLFDAPRRAALNAPDFARHVRDVDPFVTFRAAYGACTSADPLDRALYVDVKTYLVDDIMTKVDKMSMAVSLETREPMLDHKLIEFAASVPATLKIKRGQRKYLLRQLLKRRVPERIAERPKQGFDAPIGGWLRGPLAPMTQELLQDGRLRARGIFDDAEVVRLWREHREGIADHRHRLWALVMLELWFRRFVDAAGRPVSAEAAA